MDENIKYATIRVIYLCSFGYITSNTDFQYRTCNRVFLQSGISIITEGSEYSRLNQTVYGLKVGVMFLYVTELREPWPLSVVSILQCSTDTVQYLWIPSCSFIQCFMYTEIRTWNINQIFYSEKYNHIISPSSNCCFYNITICFIKPKIQRVWV